MYVRYSDRDETLGFREVVGNTLGNPLNIPLKNSPFKTLKTP